MTVITEYFVIRQRDETGRLPRLRSGGPKGREGSTPSVGTGVGKDDRCVKQRKVGTPQNKVLVNDQAP